MSTGTATNSKGLGNLYFWTAVVTTVIIFTGFAQTFYLKGLFGTPALSNLLLTHGLVMTFWLLLFITQTTLVATGRTDLHRRLGVVGAVWAVLVIAVGITTAIDAVRRGATPVPEVTPQMFMAIPFVEAAVFGALVGTALWFRRRSDIHKRLMLLATLSVLSPGIARLPFDFIKQGGLPMIIALTLIPVIICATVDAVRNRRLHPAFGWGGAFLVLSWPLRLMLAGTAAWTQFAVWMAG